MTDTHQVKRERLARLEHDGLTFDVYDEGPADGEVVVLLHGFPERSSCWREVAPLLHARGYRTVAMDQRGYSPGARPSRRRDYEMTVLGDDVAALIETVGGPVHLVGHDWGAIVAWVVALRRPDLLRSLTAISVPHPTPFVRAILTSRQFFKSWYMLLFQLPRLPELTARRVGGPVDQGLVRAGMSQDEVDRFRAEIVDYGAFSPALGWYRAIPMADRSLLRRRVSVPTTLLWSDDDIAVGRAGVERNQRYVGAPYELEVLEGVSHWIPTQEPRACADAILRRIEGVA